MDHLLSVKSALDFIENRVSEDIRQEHVAQVMGYSLSHSRDVFARVTGRTISRYVAGRKLSYGAHELANTRRQVSDIAMDYGFASHDSFTRAFRLVFGESPTRFRENRRLVGSTMITQGMYGPAVQSMKRKVTGMNEVDTQDLDQSVLYGVARISYFGKDYECTPFPSALKACLNFVGQPTSYHHLMAVTGAAFRLVWNTEYWDGGNVDIMLMRTDTIEPLRRALDSVGRDYTLLFKPEHAPCSNGARGENEHVVTGHKPAFVELIKDEIEAGRPMIGFGIIGPPEACIIAGYRNGGEILLGWNFFQDMPEYSAGIEKEPCGYFVRDGWYEHPDTLGVVALGEKRGEPKVEGLLVDTLTYALDVMETPRAADERASGFAAYDAWANDLLNESEFPEGAPIPMLMERLMCQMDGMTMIGERWQAFRFLQEQAALLPEAKAELEEAARLFREENGVAMQMGEVLGGVGMSEKQALALGRREVREGLVKLIRKARDLDMKAAEHMRLALRQLK